MPKTRVHSNLCKVLSRSQPTLTTQELQLYRQLKQRTADISPLYKKKSPKHDPNNCRMLLVVSGTLYRLYANI